jgi:hypothetical protein
MGAFHPLKLLTLMTCVATLSAADVTGIWSGQVSGRRGEPEDVSFQFKMKGQTLTGLMFGDEVDLPIEEASITGDKISFVVVMINYYSGNKARVVYKGTVTGNEMELHRERILPANETPPAKPTPNPPIKLKKIA